MFFFLIYLFFSGGHLSKWRCAAGFAGLPPFETLPHRKQTQQLWVSPPKAAPRPPAHAAKLRAFTFALRSNAATPRAMWGGHCSISDLLYITAHICVVEICTNWLIVLFFWVVFVFMCLLCFQIPGWTGQPRRQVRTLPVFSDPPSFENLCSKLFYSEYAFK